jgi:hypothetical protein
MRTTDDNRILMGAKMKNLWMQKNEIPYFEKENKLVKKSINIYPEITSELILSGQEHLAKPKTDYHTLVNIPTFQALISY